mgnify:CR=1 FL=1
MNSFFFVISATDEEKHQESHLTKRSRNLSHLTNGVLKKSTLINIFTVVPEKLSKRQMLGDYGRESMVNLRIKNSFRFFLIQFQTTATGVSASRIRPPSSSAKSRFHHM